MTIEADLKTSMTEQPLFIMKRLPLMLRWKGVLSQYLPVFISRRSVRDEAVYQVTDESLLRGFRWCRAFCTLIYRCFSAGISNWTGELCCVPSAMSASVFRDGHFHMLSSGNIHAETREGWGPLRSEESAARQLDVDVQAVSSLIANRGGSQRDFSTTSCYVATQLEMRPCTLCGNGGMVTNFAVHGLSLICASLPHVRAGSC